MGVRKMNQTETVCVDVNGRQVVLPVLEGSEGELAIDIGALRSSSGVITLDNGFVNTGSCRSSITFLNGEKGILRYRGFPIEELAEEKTFIDVSYLLMEGELPDSNQREKFKNEIDRWPQLPSDIRKLMENLPKKMHPMGVISTILSALAGSHKESLNPEIPLVDAKKIGCQLMGYLPCIISDWYRINYCDGTYNSPLPDDDYAQKFLSMMFDDKNLRSEIRSSALDVLLTLHADHEQNCSTSAVRLVGSSKASIYSSIVGGINALWGPLHGGANQAVIEMLEMIQKHGGDSSKFLQKAKDKNDPFKLMGFGHRVYKNFDPRAKIIKAHCDRILSAVGHKDELLDIAKILESEALKDDYFVDRNLYPNVDFYSGIIYRALGIPSEFFTAMFALGRLPGWLSHWYELRQSEDFKIGRPRQIYVGATERKLSR